MNVEFGYALSSEERRPTELVRNAVAAEQHGMSFAMISDHFHPWIGAQGESPFAWSVLGAIAQATSTMEVGTGVTCPIMRVHPAIIAQASATIASMMPGRFFLSVGSGEALNEHILGRHWPPPAQRIEMLAEAISVIRQLWSGEEITHRGEHFTVERCTAVHAARPSSTAQRSGLGRCRRNWPPETTGWSRQARRATSSPPSRQRADVRSRSTDSSPCVGAPTGHRRSARLQISGPMSFSPAN